MPPRVAELGHHVLFGSRELRRGGSPGQRGRGIDHTELVPDSSDVRGDSAHLCRTTGGGGNRLADPGRAPDATLHRMAVNTFLGLGLVVWPIWLPISLRLAEREAARRLVLTALFGVGVVTAVCALVLLMRWQPVAVMAGHSIRYDRAGSNGSARDLLLLLSYTLPTIVPFFVSTTSLARPIGATLVASLVLATLIQRDTLTSVWCFFAAILSSQILVAVGQKRRRLPVRVRTVSGS